ncbi:MAG: hypothetical protein L0956_01950 [Candidatus Mariimomonas ferrooxydans]
MPEEAGQHADSIVIGEAENIWKQCLDDASASKMKAVYKGEFPDLSGLPRPITNLWKTKYVYGYFQTSRGCPFTCTFCSVHKFFGGKVRMRPINEVIEEVAESRCRLFWGIDDNIWGVNVERTIELYREMGKSIKLKWWFGSGDLKSVQHPRPPHYLNHQ